MSTLEWRRGGGPGSGNVLRGGPTARRATPSRGGARGRGSRIPNNKATPDNGFKPSSEQINQPPPTTSEAPKPVEQPARPSEDTDVPNLKPKPQPNRKATRVTVPAINVQALPKSDSTPSASPSTATSTRPPNRSKRSQSNKNNKSTKPDKPTPARQSKENQTTPSLGATITKDPPPHLAPPPQPKQVETIKGDIDALVERVRAGAMERPSTPGSHIDWADDDDSLPDLDDWMKPPSTSYNGGDGVESVISPLVMGLKSLPDEKFQPKSSSLSTISLFPPSAEKSEVPDHEEKISIVPPGPEPEPSPAVSPTPPPSDKVSENQDDSELDRPGLSASMHAPKNDQPASGSASLLSLSPENGRLHPSRRPSPAHHRLSRSGASTPSDRVRGRHVRNHSTPPVTHRIPASRPVITGDAISKLARTIGGMKTKE